LFVVYGSQLIPAICRIGDGIGQGPACGSLLGNEINVRLSNGRIAVAHKTRFECCPTGEITVTFDVGEPTDAMFAVTPTSEGSARVDRRVVSRGLHARAEPDALVAAGDAGVTESIATSNLDGDRIREAIVRHDYGHGQTLSVVLLAPKHEQDVLFVWGCGS